VSRILVVDDEPSLVDVLAALLTDEGHTVQTANDGRLALEVMADELPDLLITDVMMPRLDGWGLLAAVRERTPALPVIVISAVDRRQARERKIFMTDHTVFLRKPFDIDALLTLVERLTGSHPS
jgi:CheY-like chemotaxis protein